MQRNINENDINSLQAKEIITIAMPAVFETLFTTFTSIIDTKMVSSMGTKAISAIAVTDQPRLFIMSTFLAINTVISALVAYKHGSNDRKGANSIYVTALILVGMGSIILGVVAALAARPIMLLCSGQADTMDMSVMYFRIIMLGMIFNTLFMANNATLRGCGFTKVTFVSNAIACLVHIVFDYLLIGGNLGFPALGIEGAAFATIIGNIVALIVNMNYMLKKDAFVSLLYSVKNEVKPTIDSVKEIYAMWKNVLVENLMTRIGFLISSSITARIGSLAMSVYAVGQHLMNVNYAIGNGFQTAAVALLGKCKGAGKYATMRKYANRILRYGLLFALVLSVLIVVFARPYYSFFNTEEVFIQMGIYVCWIIAIISPIQVTKIIFTGFLQGLGQMKQTMIAAIVAVTIVQPICNLIFIVILPWGLWGVWLSVLISQGTWLLIMRHYYAKTIATLPTEDIGIATAN